MANVCRDNRLILRVDQMTCITCLVVEVKRFIHEIHVDVLLVQHGLISLVFSALHESLHLTELFLLLHPTQKSFILIGVLEGIVFGVIGADKGLVFLQVALGVIEPIQVLKCLFDAHFSFLVAALLELGYACLEVILGELPAETAHCIMARSVDLCIHLLHQLSPLIVLVLPQNILNQVILCNISAQLHYVVESRLNFVMVEGLVDALAERFEPVGELFDLFVFCALCGEVLH